MDLDEYGGEARKTRALSWRDDASISLSDHIVKIETDTTTTTYNVHKVLLASGVRACDYFRQLFIQSENASFSDCKQGISEIHLPASAADAFANFLDFVYGVPLAPTTSSAVPLLHLANYFGNRELYTEVVKFIHKDLVDDTSLVYMVDAEIYKFEKVEAAAVKLCAENFARIDVGKLIHLTPALFMRVVQTAKQTCASLPLSQRVAAFCEARPAEVSKEFLNAVASASRMPAVDKSVALILLQQALTHYPSAEEDGSLRKRCVKALALDWKASLEPDEEVAPAAKRQRTSEMPLDVEMQSIKANSFEMPLDVKYEVALAALHSSETPQSELRFFFAQPQASSGLQAGTDYFLVDRKWYVGWLQWVGAPEPPDLKDWERSWSKDRPGPINNATLADPAGTSKLKRDIVEHEHYELVSEESWNLLHVWYSGGPVFRRRAIQQQPTGAVTVELYGIILHVYKSSDTSISTAMTESKTTSILQFKRRACAELGLQFDRVRIWDYFNKRRYANLEEGLNRTLDACRIFDSNDILLEELVD